MVIGPSGVYVDVGARPRVSVVVDPPERVDVALQVCMSAEAPHDDPVYLHAREYLWVTAGDAHTLYIPGWDPDDVNQGDSQFIHVLSSGICGCCVHHGSVCYGANGVDWCGCTPN